MKEGMNLQLEVNSLSLNVPELDLSCLQISLLYITNLKEFMGFSGSQSDGRGWVDPQEKDGIIKIF